MTPMLVTLDCRPGSTQLTAPGHLRIKIGAILCKVSNLMSPHGRVAFPTTITAILKETGTRMIVDAVQTRLVFQIHALLNLIAWPGAITTFILLWSYM